MNSVDLKCMFIILKLIQEGQFPLIPCTSYHSDPAKKLLLHAFRNTESDIMYRHAQ